LDNWGLGVQGVYGTDKDTIKALSPFPIAAVAVQPAAEAFHLVMNNVGAIFPKRDVIDSRIINEVKSGTATYGGRYYAILNNLDTTKIYGIIDSQSDVGGWPLLNSIEAPADTDHDGMPDSWENANGLDKNNPNDRNNINSAGYTMLELYINSLVPELITSVEKQADIPREFKLFTNYPNPFNPETMIQFLTPAPGEVEVNIFDINGKEIYRLFKGIKNSGLHRVSWRGIREGGERVASGVYLCKVRFNKNYRTQKLLLLK